MMNSNFIEGVNIIARHIPKEKLNDFGVHGEHDQIWFGEYEWVDNEKDKSRLEELGWFENENSWSCFT